jgi:hypothetical protein
MRSARENRTQEGVAGRIGHRKVADEAIERTKRSRDIMWVELGSQESRSGCEPVGHDTDSAKVSATLVD